MGDCPRSVVEAEPPVLVARHQLALILGVHPDRISEYTGAGLPIVHRGGRGRGPSQYDAIACAEWVRRHRPGTIDAQQEKARLDQARRVEIELRTRRRSGALVPAKDVEALASSLVVSARTAFLGLPAKLGARFSGVDRGLILALDAEIRQILTELADGAERAREAVKPEGST